jgi:predicted dienelactone hydrolase
MIRRALALASVLAVAAACSRFPDGPGDLLAAPNVERDGTSGTDGARGAAWVTVNGQARVTERIPVQVVFPARADGTLDPAGAPYPTVVFLQGASVARDRYHWLALHLATRGYVVLLPEHLLDLTILDTDNARLGLGIVREAASAADGTLRGAIDPAARAVVMGHSLGGVIAARQWIAHPDFSGLALLAAYPATGDRVAARAAGPLFAMTGTADTLAPPTRVRAGYEMFSRSPDALQAVAVVDSLNHYGWTDAAEDDERASDGPRPPDLWAVRRRALAVLDAWLDATMRDDTNARQLLSIGRFDGVSVTR